MRDKTTTPTQPDLLQKIDDVLQRQERERARIAGGLAGALERLGYKVERVNGNGGAVEVASIPALQVPGAVQATEATRKPPAYAPGRASAGDTPGQPRQAMPQGRRADGRNGKRPIRSCDACKGKFRNLTRHVNEQSDAKHKALAKALRKARAAA